MAGVALTGGPGHVAAVAVDVSLVGPGLEDPGQVVAVVGIGRMGVVGVLVALHDRLLERRRDDLRRVVDRSGGETDVDGRAGSERPDERLVGKSGGCPVRYRWSWFHLKKKIINKFS